MIDPEMDGIDHINVYSKAKTELGRFLSNFALAPIETEDGYFASVEGYWYWLSCKDDRLRKLYGYLAKKRGRELRGNDWVDDEEFARKIKEAIRIKLEKYDRYLQELKKIDLPLAHYYVYGDKVVNVPEAQWILDFIDYMRDQ